MHSLTSALSRRKLFLTALALCAAICATALAARSGRWPSPSAHAATQGGQTPSAAQQQQQGMRLEAELVTFRQSGPDPLELRRPPGPFVLLVENVSGDDLGTLRLGPETDGLPAHAQALAEARMQRGRFDWSQALELPPGSYVLRRVDGAGPSCRIVIDPSLASKR